MKSLILSPSHNIWGGGQIYIESLADFVIQSGGDIRIASSEPESFSVPTILLPRIDDRRQRLKRAATIAFDFRALGYDRVLLNDLSALWMAPFFRAAKLDVAALLHMHPQARTGPGLGHSRFERILLWASSHACQRIFSVNRQNAQAFGKRVEFVGNYASDAFFSDEHASRRTDEHYDVIFIARLAPEKNPLLFVSLVQACQARAGRAMRALIIGAGPLESDVAKAICDAGLESTIEMRGWVPRESLPGILDQARCFVMTSFYEGFATTVIEAQARGVPVVTTETSGFCPEFVRGFGGSTGIVFDASNYEPAALSDQILRLIGDAEELAPFCRRKAALFTKESVLSPIRNWLVGEV